VIRRNVLIEIERVEKFGSDRRPLHPSSGSAPKHCPGSVASQRTMAPR
jgi:hypothetical protein